MTWHPIGNVAEIPAGQRKQVNVAGRELMLLHTEQGIYCVDYRCPHTGGPLGDGLITGEFIVCPLHKWKFDLGDGTHNHPGVDCPPAGVYELKLSGEELLVSLEG